MPAQPVGPPRDKRFSEREWQVLQLLVAGASNPEIGRILAFSASTIRNDLTVIYRKLGARSRADAAARAIALGVTGDVSAV